MDRHERRSQPLEVAAGLARLLGAAREQAGRSLQVSLDVDRVRDVEGTMGVVIPDAVLAMIAADLPVLRDEFRLRLGELAAHGRAARAAGARGDFMAVASDPGGRAYHGFLKRNAASHMAVFSTLTRAISSVDTPRWLADRLGLKAAGDGLSLQVSLDLAMIPEGEGARVRHAVFGVGRVIVDDGEGPTRKIKVDFPGIGLKVLQARFVTHEE